MRDAGQPRRCSGDALLYELPGPDDVGSILEEADDRRQSEYGLRPQRAHPGNAVERVFERHGDETLDLFRRKAGRLGLYFDARRREFGKHVERDLRRSAYAKDEQQEREREYEDALAKRKGDDRTQHAALLVAYAEFGPEQFGRADGDDLRPFLGAARKHCDVSDDSAHVDAATRVDMRGGALVNPFAAIDVVEDRRPGRD